MAWSITRAGRLVAAATILTSVSIASAPAAAETRLDRFVTGVVTKMFAKPKKTRKARPAKASGKSTTRQGKAGTVLPDSAPLPTASPDRMAKAIPAVLTGDDVAVPILAFAPVVPLPPFPAEPSDNAAEVAPPATTSGDDLPILAFAPVVPLPELEPAPVDQRAEPAPAVIAPPVAADPQSKAADETAGREEADGREEIVVALTVPPPSALKPVPPSLLDQPEEDEAEQAATAETAPQVDPAEVILASIPVPQWRPDISGGMLPEKREPYIDPATGTRATSPAEELACRARLSELGVKYTELGFIGDPDGCAVTNPISVKSLGAGIELSPSTTMNCAMAAATASFAQSVVAESAQTAFGSALAGIEHASAYMCRPRHGLQKLSEHAFGNALDITAFRLEDGRRVEVRDTDIVLESDFLTAVRTAACGPFKTVLGPGNADHDTHFHFDLQPRKRNGAYCP